MSKLRYKIDAGQGMQGIGAGVASVTQTVMLPVGLTLPPVITVQDAANVAGRASLPTFYVNGTTEAQLTLKMQTSDNANIGTRYNIVVNWIATQRRVISATS
ncbi:hypothetical protein [Arthrobacter sp. Soil736]|uniref:hypothetical protein n=1 Tax=Arthrobacter sp. Soil736 TaxID=1736395 RepID=UPI000A93CFCD|nr:hypothetical protein [Arthrobacter sp. Soil736]